ncbi:MAG: class D sortase [Pseudomonadota bacterium]
MSCLGCAPMRPLDLPRPANRSVRAARATARKIVAASLIVAGLITAASALHHPAKARLGQHLLATAWEAGGAKPWAWADFTAYARIEAPGLGVSAIALSTSTGAAMAWGPGHVTGAPRPGDPGLAAFAGHRDSHFAFLGDLKPGDAITVETTGVRRLYRVTAGVVVDSRKWRMPTGGAERLALSTCWPLGAETPGPLRLILFADPVEPA